jgi:uncharacterized membrane protein YebE (DUF533 family)
MNRIVILAATAFLATTSIASAQSYGYGNSPREIDARQAQQERRINQGVRSGELTRGEYQKLESEQAHVRQLERQAKADGYISPAERARIREAQNQASRHIYQEKHGGDRSNARPWWRWN